MCDEALDEELYDDDEEFSTITLRADYAPIDPEEVFTLALSGLRGLADGLTKCFEQLRAQGDKADVKEVFEACCDEDLWTAAIAISGLYTHADEVRGWMKRPEIFRPDLANFMLYATDLLKDFSIMMYGYDQDEEENQRLIDSVVADFWDEPVEERATIMDSLELFNEDARQILRTFEMCPEA